MNLCYNLSIKITPSQASSEEGVTTLHEVSSARWIKTKSELISDYEINKWSQIANSLNLTNKCMEVDRMSKHIQEVYVATDKVSQVNTLISNALNVPKYIANFAKDYTEQIESGNLRVNILPYYKVICSV